MKINDIKPRVMAAIVDDSMKAEAEAFFKEHGTEELSASTRDINGVEIFAAGTWNGDPYTVDDIDEIVESFKDTKDFLKPFLKLGHNKGQKLLADDGLPAAGWIDKVYRKGDKLLADFKAIPRKIADIVDRGGYRRVSSEIFFNIKIMGKTYKKALRAVALLGGETPAVHNLQDIINLYADGGEAAAYKSESESKRYEIDFSTAASTEEQEMKTIEQLTAELAAANDRIATLTAEANKVGEFKTRAEKAETELTAEKAKVATLEGEKAEFAQKQRKAEITGKVDKLVTDKKITPAQKPLLVAILSEAKFAEGKEFAVGDKKYKTIDDLVFEFAERSGEVPEAETPESANGGARNDGKPGHDADADALHAKAKAYSEKHKVSYKDALLEVSAAPVA
jgi:hypothetical protein